MSLFCFTDYLLANHFIMLIVPLINVFVVFKNLLFGQNWHDDVNSVFTNLAVMTSGRKF